MDKPIVTKRNHFTSLELFIEDALKDYGDTRTLTYSEMANLLMRFSDHLTHSLSQDFATAAKQGIEQAVRLIRDPEYFETAKRRRSREKERHEDYQAKQERESWRRRFEPTQEEIERGIADCERDIDWHSRRLNMANTRLLELKAIRQDVMPEFELTMENVQ